MDAAIAVKEAVLPFGRFHGVDTVLGPEMKSTGEVMGIDTLFGTAYAKSQVAAYAGGLPTSGHRLRVGGQPRQAVDDLPGQAAARPRLRDRRRPPAPPRCSAATACRRPSSASTSRSTGATAEPDTISRILDGTIDIIVNTPYGVGARLDGYEIRSAAVTKGVPCITTVQGLGAAVQGIEALIRGEVGVRSLQEHAADLDTARGGACMTPVQVRGEVLSIRRVGEYHQLTIVAPGVAEQVRPGHFVALAVGGETTAHLLRRAFSVYRTQDRGVYGGTDRHRLRRARQRAPGGCRGCGSTTRSTSSDRWASRSPCPRSRSPAPWSAVGTAARRCSRWPSSCASVAAGSTSCSARRPRAGCSACSRPSGCRSRWR